MIITLFIRLAQMLLLISLQVLVLNQIHLWGYGSPMIYPLILIFMPLGTSRVSTLLWGFCTGLLVDVFSNTPGVGSGAMTFVALIQPPILRIMVPRDASEDIRPTYRSMGRWNHIHYVLLVFGLHHLIYFLLESFSFFHLQDAAISMVVSWATSVLLAFAIERIRNDK